MANNFSRGVVARWGKVVVAIDMLMPNTNTHVKCPINCNGKYSHSMTLTMALTLAKLS